MSEELIKGAGNSTGAMADASGESFFFPQPLDHSYLQTLTGAHQNAPPRLRPPALISHVGFWHPLEVIENQSLAQARKARKKKADTYLLKLWDHLRALELAKDPEISKLSPSPKGESIRLFGQKAELHLEPLNLVDYDENDLEAHTGVRQVSFSFKWMEVDVVINFVQRTEYFAATFIIDLSPAISARSFDKLSSSSSKHVLSRIVAELEKLDIKVADARYFDSSEYVKSFEAPYEDVWNEFYDLFLKSQGDLEANLGKIFCDFRGSILSTPIRVHRRKGLAFQQPFWRKSRENTPATQMKYRRGFRVGLKVPDWQDKIDQFWRFLNVKIHHVDFSDYEFTASTMLNEQVLYVTALGAQPERPKDEVRVPLYYFIYSNDYSGWQLGRLVERINYLGITRLSASLAVPQFREAAYKMRQLSAKAVRARETYIGKTDPADPETDREETRSKETLKRLQEDIEGINEEFSRISIDFLSSRPEYNLGSISYRLNRSQYYIEEFITGVDALKLGYIPGFQRYDEFVQRRLGPAFNTIAAIKMQHEELRRQVDSLGEYYSVEHAHFVEEQTRNRSRELEQLGDIADLALWCALLPYYGGSLLLHYMFKSDDWTTVARVMWWGLIWIIVAGIGVGLHFHKNKKRKNPTNLWPAIQWGASLVAVTFAALLGIASVIDAHRAASPDASRAAPVEGQQSPAKR